ncbi:MAG: anion permease [Halodesulfurarchaeum sp.]
MSSADVILLLVAAVGASFFTAWTIGAGSSGSTPFAPAVGANALSTMRAAFVVGILGFLGAVFQGANVTETIGNEFIRGVSLSPLAATIALLTAASLIAAGVFRGYPIATAFAVSGGVVGAGIALGGSPAWDTYVETALFWALTPVVGGTAAYGTARALRSPKIPEEVLVPALGGVVGVILATMEFTGLGRSGESASVAVAIAIRVPGPDVLGIAAVTVAVALAVVVLLRRATVRDADTAQRRFLVSLGALVAFSAGGGKVGLAIGPLLPLLSALPVAIPLVAVLIFGGVGLLLGSWMASTRMIKALSQDYSELGPRRSIAVLIPSFAIAQAGIFLGVPMSFNEIFVSAIVGSGYAAGGESVSRSKMVNTVLAWVGSLGAAFLVAYASSVALEFVGVT